MIDYDKNADMQREFLAAYELTGRGDGEARGKRYVEQARLSFRRGSPVRGGGPVERRDALRA
jgi:hypothetical protein